MAAVRPRPSAATASKQGAGKAVSQRRIAAREEAEMLREGEALLAKINRGIDEAITRADRLLARMG